MKKNLKLSGNVREGDLVSLRKGNRIVKCRSQKTILGAYTEGYDMNLLAMDGSTFRCHVPQGIMRKGWVVLNVAEKRKENKNESR